MRQVLMVAIILLSGISTTASAQRIDVNGRCHGPDGKLAAMTVCKPATVPTTGVPRLYILDAAGRCRDEAGQLVDRSFCKR